MLEPSSKLGAKKEREKRGGNSTPSRQMANEMKMKIMPILAAYAARYPSEVAVKYTETKLLATLSTEL